MFLHLRCSAGLLLLSLGLCGCYSSGVGQQEEERNPYFLAGKERVSARDYKGAIEAFDRALEINPRSALAHYELGVLYEQRENDYPAAIYHYAKVLKLRPNGAYPAENAKLRIPGCKQEMVKNDMLATTNPTAMQELERLRAENQQLQGQVQSLNAALAATRASLQQLQQSPPHPAVAPTPGPSPAPPAMARPPTPTPAASNTPVAARKHTVKLGETPSSIAKQYRTRTEALMAANPGLDPKRLRPGQVLNLP